MIFLPGGVPDELDDVDDPPMSDVIDAALTHLIESQENLEDVRHEYPPEQIHNDYCNCLPVRPHEGVRSIR